MEFAAPGVYVLRATEEGALGQQMVSHWLLHTIQPSCSGCLWLTASSPKNVRMFLDQILSSHRKGPKGLDILCLSSSNAKQNNEDSVLNLCRSLSTLVVLKPALLILEDAQRWLGHEQPKQTKQAKEATAHTPLDQMRLLQRWADHTNVRVLIPCHGDLPHWSTFATGFAEVNALGDWVFSPWWPSEQGMQSMLWNESRSATSHCLLDARAFTNLHTLGLAVYRLRFFSDKPGRIYILNTAQISPINAIALLRLGADEVIHSTRHLPKQTQTLNPTPADFELAQTNPALANAFAKDLHELWMPGRLQCLPVQHFAQNGQMTLQLMQGWGVHMQVLRLSLRKHIHAAMALQLFDAGAAGAMVCATREAIYLIKLWAAPPTPEAFESWHQSCFGERLETLFSGHVVIENLQQQETLLASLSEELNIELDPNLNHFDPQHQELPELWTELNTTTTVGPARPWLQRLEPHFKDTNHDNLA